MPIIAPEVARFSIVGQYGGQLVVNVIDVSIDTDPGTTRPDAIFNVAGDLLNQWSDHVLPLLQPEYSAQEVRWVDLDSLSGSTGARSSTDGSTWPEAGTQTGFPMPGNVTMRMVKQITGARGRRAGQLKLAGMSEGYTLDGSPNVWDPAAIAAFNTAFEDLKDGINGAVAEGYTANIVVVHTVDDEWVATSPVTNFSGAPTVGSMIRRLPGYGA